jgi:4'-phosphopantetheinyl transferase
MCALAPSGVALGCDLEIIEPRSDVFAADYFTDEEKELVARAGAAERPRLLTLLWSAKESALKALREGLRLDTRSVAVSFDQDSVVAPTSQGANHWLPFQVRCASGQVFYGWWQNTKSLVRTVVAAPPSSPPILLVPDA